MVRGRRDDPWQPSERVLRLLRGARVASDAVPAPRSLPTPAWERTSADGPSTSSFVPGGWATPLGPMTAPTRHDAAPAPSGGWLPAPPPSARGRSDPGAVTLVAEDLDEGSRGESGGTGSSRDDRPRPAGRHRAPAPRVVQLPSYLAVGRFQVRGVAVVAVVVFVLLLGGVFALRVAAAQRSAEPVPVVETRSSTRFGQGSATGPTSGSGASGVPVSTGATTAGGVAATAAGPSGSGGGGPPASLVVHVVGQVAHPGVVRVPDGSRVVDAIAAAGGALPSAELERINLASLLRDGEQVHVPAPGEAILPGAFVGGTGGAAGTGSGGGSAGGTPALVDLNRADLAVLDTLPGVGPVLAQRILDWRTEHGRFTTVDELGEVSGIGEKMLAQLRPRVSV